MISTRTITFPAETSNLLELRSFITRAVLDEHVDINMLYSLELAVDEAATNIIDHVASEMPCDIFCQCSIDKDQGLAICEISWQSKEPFRPEIFPETEHIRKRLEARQSRGLGIFLIHSLMDDIEYDYKEGKSIIRLIKKMQ